MGAGHVPHPGGGRFAEPKAAFEAQLAKDTEFRNRVKTQVEQLAEKFEKARLQVDALLVEQAAAEQVLFDLQRTVGRLLADMFQMEEELTLREIGRSKPRGGL